MMRDTLFSAVITMIGVVCGIRAVYGGVRLDWAETALIAGVVMITIGVIKLFQTMKGENEDELI